ncbi:MAG: hypothetical protein IPK52_27195 [Chloroflexi bacterium]|nr:hypothetical protein [Chloroflexota bacterium]
MFFWLFTDGRDLLAGLLWPLLCVMPFLVVGAAAALGAGIRRDSEEGSGFRGRHLLLTATHAAILLTVAALYVALLGDHAIRRGRNTASGLIGIVTGARAGPTARGCSCLQPC